MATLSGLAARQVRIMDTFRGQMKSIQNALNEEDLAGTGNPISGLLPLFCVRLALCYAIILSQETEDHDGNGTLVRDIPSGVTCTEQVVLETKTVFDSVEECTQTESQKCFMTFENKFEEKEVRAELYSYTRLFV